MNSLIRSRWAAIGAAVAVTLGAGGLISVNAANDTSSLVPITPARILDTRSGDRVGSLDTAGASDPYRLKVVGTDGIPTSGVTGVSLNVTAVDTRTNDYGGFVSVYPCASVSSAKPDVSNMNFGSGQTIANAVTVPVSADGYICLYVYGTAHLLVDANGYYTESGSGTVEAYTKSETDSKLEGVESALLNLATGMQIPTIVDSNNAGQNSSIAIGANGLPIISYNTGTTGDVKVAACTSANCSSSTITAVSLDGYSGTHSSIAVGANGLPIISYYDSTNDDLRVAACTAVDCSSYTNRFHDGVFGSDVGMYTSIAIGANGLPIISYYDASYDNLRVAACTSADCSSSTITVVDSDGDVGWYTSIAIGANGLPIISYLDYTNGNLKVAACTSADCSSSTITVVDSDGRVGMYTSIAIGANGLPIISYLDYRDHDLKVAACTSADCSSSTITVVDSDGGVGMYTSIAIGANGLPIISYHDYTNVNLKVAACTSADCSSSTITVVDSDGGVGLYTSIAIGANGLPIISYRDFTNKNLKVVSMLSLLLAN